MLTVTGASTSIMCKAMDFDTLAALLEWDDTASEPVYVNDRQWHPDAADPALIGAATSGDVDTIRERATKGAVIDGVDEDGWTALVHAVMNNQVEAVRCLLELGADPDVEASDDEASLVDAAAERGYAEVAWALLRAGAADSTDGFDESRCPVCARAILIGSADECGHWVLRLDSDFTWSSDAAQPLVDAAEELDSALSDLDYLANGLPDHERLQWLFDAYHDRSILSELLDRAEGTVVTTPYEATSYLMEWCGSDLFLEEPGPTLSRALVLAQSVRAEVAALHAQLPPEGDG
jgi:hypothetical protein